MTRFRRDSFVRTSGHGVSHVVRGHWVDRSAWGHSGSNNSSSRHFHAYLAQVNANGSAAARFVNRNAKCPECGASVYYYQNEYGSCVFFDELGRPWPKHPCTDSVWGNNGERKRQRSTFKEVLPEFRSDDEILMIHNALLGASIDSDINFQQQYGRKPWIIATVIKRLRTPEGFLLAARSFNRGNSSNIFFFCRSLNAQFRRGFVFAVRGTTVEFFDIKKMAPVEVEVERLKSGSAFLHRLLM